MTTQTAQPATATRGSARLYAALMGLASIGVLLQGVWAGVFIREGKDNSDHWVNVHARGADVCILLAVLATGVAVVKLRDYRSLVALSGAFVVLLILEAYLGGLVGDHNAVEEIHFPLGMALTALAVYLPVKSRALTSTTTTVRA